MRSKKYIFSFLLLVIPRMGCTAPHTGINTCNESTPLIKKLIGSWHRENKEKIVLYNFHQNGIFDGYVSYKGLNEVWVFSSSWELNKNTIFYVYKYMKQKGVDIIHNKGLETNDRIISINCHELVFKEKSGELLKYHR